MAIKRKITKEEYEKLPDILKSEYREKGGSYIAIIDGDDDAVEALRKAKENEVANHKETQRRLKELEEKLNSQNHEDNKKKGDVEALEKSWSEKYNKDTGELKTQLETMQKRTVNSYVDSTVTQIASKISNSPALMKRVLNDRVTGELNENGDVVIKVLGTDGKPSALTLDDLEKEILANKEYSPILIASKASGGGAAKPGAGGGATNSNNAANGEKPNLGKMLPSQFAAHRAANKQQE